MDSVLTWKSKKLSDKSKMEISNRWKQRIESRGLVFNKENYKKMSEQGQFKNFTTRKFRADLHYRLKLLAATRGITMEVAFNEILEKGLDELEKVTGLTIPKQGV